mgnify:CR=1
MANTYLERTFGSAGNRKTFTISTWVKRSKLGTAQSIFYGDPSGSTNGEQDDFYFGSDKINFGGWQSNYISSTAVFRDTSAWYHIVLAVDTTQATSSNRIKLYVNGVEQARSEGVGYPAQNFDTAFIKAGTFRIAGNSGASGYGDYVLSHFHFIDGTAYDATEFGEYDANGVWKIKTSPSVTYGTNGFFILKDGNSVTDQSGNSNNFTVGGGTLTNTEDNPSNVFATFNAIWNLSNGKNLTLTNGNTTTQSNSANWNGAISTIGVSTGKYYWEAKIVSATNNYNFGVVDPDVADVNNTDNIMNQVGYSGFYNFDGGETRIDNVVSTSDYGTFGNGDILGFALDKTNNQFSIYKNGTIIVTNASLGQGNGTVLPINIIYGTNQGSSNFNFGNGYFGTTAVASAGTNASGIGIFEYDVPTGFTALSTKGLNL